MTVVCCRHVTRRYARSGIAPVVAVDAVDFEVEAGQLVTIQGPSGSGKTTLLGLLAGLEAPDEGSVTILGHDLSRLSDDERARLRQRRVGLVFQSFGLIASLPVHENVELPLALAGVAEDERAARADGVLNEVGLGPLASARIDELSGGERQRVGVARALVIDPSLILADEPTGSLDDQNAASILKLLANAVRRRGASLVLVTHDPETARTADRHFVMHDGHLTRELAE